MAPEELTLENLSQINPLQIAAPITTMTAGNMLLVARDVMRSITLSQSTAFNRFYSRLLNEMMLKRFDLHDYHKLFTLDEEAVKRILARNPALKAEQFYTARPNRPYLICGATHIYPPGPEQVLRQFELSPLYAGMPQLFPKAGHEGTDLGGAYIETFAFDSEAPLERSSSDVVTVPMPEPLFLLSDMIGSTSAAPGVMLDHYQDPSLMPEFKMWPFTSLESSSLYSIVDGDALENLGIVPLLRRQYPIILSFVNVFFPLGSNTPLMVGGLIMSQKKQGRCCWGLGIE